MTWLGAEEAHREPWKVEARTCWGNELASMVDAALQPKTGLLPLGWDPQERRAPAAGRQRGSLRRTIARIEPVGC